MNSLTRNLLIAFTILTVSGEEIPDFLHICHRTDPELNQCVANSINHLKPYLRRGIPEYDIISLEPLELGDLLVSGSKTGQGLSISAKDILVHGSGDWNLENFQVVEYASKYTFLITLPHLYVTGRYIVDGRVLFLPITGNGQITCNFTNGEGAIRLKGTQKEINGNTHFVVTKLDIKIKVESGKIELNNLFGGDKQLGTVINKVINENFDTFTNDLIPLIEKSLAKIFKSTGNKIFKRFTMAQLFP